MEDKVKKAIIDVSAIMGKLQILSIETVSKIAKAINSKEINADNIRLIDVKEQMMWVLGLLFLRDIITEDEFKEAVVWVKMLQKL